MVEMRKETYMQKSKQLTSWSFSRYSDYRQCPLKTKLKHIDHLKEPANLAMERGADIHKKAEFYLKGVIARMPVELKLFSQLAKTMRIIFEKQNGILVEETWAFTKSWEKTRWDDWTNCWLRIKLDCAYFVTPNHLNIYDWKTGKFRIDSATEYLEQLELYALGALLLYPNVTQVTPQLIYLDSGQRYPENSLTFFQEDVENLKKQWVKRTRAMLTDVRFAPRPNRFCGWCHYRASNKANGGGQCRY